MIATLLRYFPFLMVVVFFICVAMWPFPEKRLFILRAVRAATIAVLLCHLNRSSGWYPPSFYCPSGHMALSLSVAVSLGLLRPWTLAITLPILIFFGIGLVAHRFHTTLDVLAAVPLVLLVYALVFRAISWPGSRPLDSRPRSL
jgi:hypothetical protein